MTADKETLERIGELEARIGYLETDRETLLEVVGIRISAEAQAVEARLAAIEGRVQRAVEAASGIDTDRLVSLLDALGRVESTATTIRGLCFDLDKRLDAIRADERRLSADELSGCVDDVIAVVQEAHEVSVSGDRIAWT